MSKNTDRYFPVHATRAGWVRRGVNPRGLDGVQLYLRLKDDPSFLGVSVVPRRIEGERNGLNMPVAIISKAELRRTERARTKLAKMRRAG